MDVSTSLLSDTKVKRLLRHAPDRYPVAVLAYLSAMAESWKVGRRVTVEDSWPVGVPFDPLAIEALSHVGLVDASGLIVPRTWRSWFGKAKSRREKSRTDWRRWQESHRQNKRGSPGPGHGGVSPDSTPDKSIPSVPTVRPSDKGIQGDTPLDEEPRRIGLANPVRTA